MKRYTMGIVASVALIGSVAVHGVSQAAMNRDEDTVLFAVGKLRLQDNHGITCVLYVADESFSDKRPVSAWLLDKLRKVRPGLVTCGDTSHDELYLGPVHWIKPSKEAFVFFGGFGGEIGRQSYRAHRGFLGRWHFTPMIRL
jgi:hypothetical protein